MDVTIVVASCQSSLRWLLPLAQKNYRMVVIEQCSHGAKEGNAVLPPPSPPRHRRNSTHPFETTLASRCGREAHSYLHFITHFWEQLPERMVFLQGDFERHAAVPSLDGTQIDAQRLPAVIESLVNSRLQFAHLPGIGEVVSSACSVHPSYLDAGVCQIYRHVSGAPNCTLVSGVTYAHFYATRRAVRRRPRELYLGLDEALFVERGAAECRTKHARHASALERMWSYLFGCSTPLCAFTGAPSCRMWGWAGSGVSPPCRWPGTQARVAGVGPRPMLVATEESERGCAQSHGLHEPRRMSPPTARGRPLL